MRAEEALIKSQFNAITVPEKETSFLLSLIRSEIHNAISKGKTVISWIATIDNMRSRIKKTKLNWFTSKYDLLGVTDVLENDGYKVNFYWWSYDRFEITVSWSNPQ